jgi:hypothetical protein
MPTALASSRLGPPACHFTLEHAGTMPRFRLLDEVPRLAQVGRIHPTPQGFVNKGRNRSFCVLEEVQLILVAASICRRNQEVVAGPDMKSGFHPYRECPGTFSLRGDVHP